MSQILFMASLDKKKVSTEIKSAQNCFSFFPCKGLFKVTRGVHSKYSFILQEVYEQCNGVCSVNTLSSEKKNKAEYVP